MGSQRIASELMGAPFDADDLADNPLEGPGGMEKTQGGSSYPGSGAMGALSAWASFDTLLQRLDITTDPDFWDGLVTLIPYQDYFLESQYTDLEEGCVPGETQQGPNKTQTPNTPNQPDPECLCANSPFYAWEIHGIECNEYRLLYWYHPDYGTSRAAVARSKARLATVMRDLGHNEFITDYLSRACRGMSGLPYQYFHYSAFGETLVEDNAHYGQFSSPYRFNAKELDGETGNYYYGARYYNPTTSVWLSVDPLHARSPNLTPYHFVSNNPIMRIDPNGLTDFLNEESGNSIHVEDGSDDIVMVGSEQYESILGLSMKQSWTQEDSENYFGIIESGTSYSPNEYGMYQFPESGNGFARYTDANGNNNGNNENYKVKGETYHSDNWASKETFLALYKTFREFNIETGITVHYGDISAYDPKINLGHSTHFTGNSVDIHYFDYSGNERRGKCAYWYGDIDLTNRFFEIAKANGFHQTYSYGKLFTPVKNNNQSAHKDHLHVGR